VKAQLDELIMQMYRSGITYVEAVREFKKAFLLTALKESNGNQSKAAPQLGMHRNSLARSLSDLELDARALRPGGRRPPGRAPSLSVVKKVSR
jgi:Fis family transcriptional regulator, factor for inversion stimulation protein